MPRMGSKWKTWFAKCKLETGGAVGAFSPPMFQYTFVNTAGHKLKKICAQRSESAQR